MDTEPVLIAGATTRRLSGDGLPPRKAGRCSSREIFDLCSSASSKVVDTVDIVLGSSRTFVLAAVAAMSGFGFATTGGATRVRHFVLATTWECI